MEKYQKFLINIVDLKAMIRRLLIEEQQNHLVNKNKCKAENEEIHPDNYVEKLERSLSKRLSSLDDPEHANFKNRDIGGNSGIGEFSNRVSLCDKGNVTSFDAYDYSFGKKVSNPQESVQKNTTSQNVVSVAHENVSKNGTVGKKLSKKFVFPSKESIKALNDRGAHRMELPDGDRDKSDLDVEDELEADENTNSNSNIIRKWMASHNINQQREKKIHSKSMDSANKNSEKSHGTPCQTN